MHADLSRLIRARLPLVLLLVLAATGLTADTARDMKPSEYAPMQELSAQIEMFVEDIAEDLEDEEEYGPDQQNRVSLNASTLIVLGQTLGAHDEASELKKSAAALVDCSSSLVDNVDELAGARQSLAEVRQALTEPAVGATDWEPVAELSYLMKQVPIVNNSLRRGVTGRRFERMMDRNAGYATTLAAIAQASMFYTDYVADEEDQAKWSSVCADMRDAATQVREAVRGKDLPAAEAGLAKLVETCDACHDSFR